MFLPEKSIEHWSSHRLENRHNPVNIISELNKGTDLLARFVLIPVPADDTAFCILLDLCDNGTETTRRG